MKVTQLMIARGFGGAERSFVDTCIALADRGVTVQAVCHPQFRRRDLLESRGIRVDRVTVRNRWDILAQRRVNRAIAAFGPDLIHCHLARGASVAGKAGRRLGIPVIVKMHNYAQLKYYRNVDIFIGTTQDQRRYLLEHGKSPQQVAVIPNFCTLPAVHHVPEPETTQTVFIACGRLVPVKAYDVLIEALRRVIDQGINARLILGDIAPAMHIDLDFPG